MKNDDKQAVNPNKLKAFATNAVSEIHTTESEAQVPITSDHCVEEARDWVNDGSKL